MREIKFRAIHKNGGAILDNKECLRLMYNQECQTFGNLISYELMQFTGLKDKNGTEIYEGDILKGSYLKVVGSYCKAVDIDSSGIVEFTNDAQFAIFYKTSKSGVKQYKYFHKLWPLGPNQYEIEVIGNIHTKS